MPIIFFSHGVDELRREIQLASKEDLETVRQLVQSRSADDSETGNEVLRLKAKTNGYCILRDALQQGYVDVAKVMLNFGAGVNNSYGGGRANTPLHHAVARRYKDIVELLLLKGANVNARNRNGETPLHLAVGTKTAGAASLRHNIVFNKSAPSDNIDVYIVMLLLPFGADVKARIKNGASPFETAIEKGCTEVIIAMFNHCHPYIVHDHGSDGEYPLLKSVRSGNVGIVSLLLDKGALVNVKSVTENNYSALHHAISYGFDSIVEVLLSKPGIEVNCKSRQGKTPLHLAIQRRNVNCVSSLLERGADINILDGSGKTLLHYAASYDREGSIVSALFVQGTNVNAVDDAGKTALHYAAYNDQEGSIVSALLVQGADVNMVDNEGKTALHDAARLICRVNVMLTLLDQKAEINLQDVDGKTPLHYVVSCSAVFKDRKISGFCSLRPNNFGNEKEHTVSTVLDHGAEIPINNDKGEVCVKPTHCLEHLVSSLLSEHGAKTNVKDKEGNTALHYAVKRLGSVDLVTPLLTHGADINAKNCEGMTALHVAAKHCKTARVSILIQHGADVKIKDDEGCTALHYVAGGERDNGDLITILFTHGADINAKTHDGRTALHFAAATGYEVHVSTLLKYGAESNARDESGFSALHRAASRTEFFGDLITPLLIHGAEVNCTSTGIMSGVTALHFAARHGLEENVRALLEHGADVNIKDFVGNTALSYAAAICGNSGEFVTPILVNGANVNSTNHEGKTALHIAASRCQDRQVKVLLQHGAEVNPKDDAGCTALHYATDRGALGSLLSLLTHGADVNAKNLVGDTALHIAVRKSSENVVPVLLAHGADVDCRGEFGKTALYVASEEGDSDIVEILLKHGADVNITIDRHPYDTPLSCAKKTGCR